MSCPCHTQAPPIGRISGMFNPSAFAAVFYPTKLKHSQPSCPDLFRASTSVFPWTAGSSPAATSLMARMFYSDSAPGLIAEDQQARPREQQEHEHDPAECRVVPRTSPKSWPLQTR